MMKSCWPKPYEAKLTKPMKAAARLLVCGRRVSHVAAELEVHTATIRRWCKSSLFTEYLAELERNETSAVIRQGAEVVEREDFEAQAMAEAKTRVFGLVRSAVDVLELGLRKKVDRERLAAAKMTLDLVGFIPPARRPAPVARQEPLGADLLRLRAADVRDEGLA